MASTAMSLSKAGVCANLSVKLGSEVGARRFVADVGASKAERQNGGAHMRFAEQTWKTRFRSHCIAEKLANVCRLT